MVFSVSGIVFIFFGALSPGKSTVLTALSFLERSNGSRVYERFENPENLLGLCQEKHVLTMEFTIYLCNEETQIYPFLNAVKDFLLNRC